MYRTILVLTLLFAATLVIYPQKMELNQGWKARRISDIQMTGEELTLDYSPDASWIDATVPGTVLTTLLNNNLVPDPFLSFGNAAIPDISDTGPGHYSYWFFNIFHTDDLPPNQQIWLELRGVNYSCDIYLNGHHINKSPANGMFLRHRFNITRFINQGARNKLALAVYPPEHTGKPNGGQGGDGTIGRNVSMQFTAGWDWIEPVADRNTGIWDKVILELTGPVNIIDPQVTTRVPGVRLPGEMQAPAFVTFAADLQNTGATVIEGEFGVRTAAVVRKKKVKLQPGETVKVSLKPIKIKQPRLWWPNGMGTRVLYSAQLYFETGKKKKTVSDTENLRYGIRQISSSFDEKIGGRVFYVNGQKVFVRGGNWVASDVLLRLSQEKYAAEIGMLAAMNMNMLRVWGGSMTERPDFYEACDDNGIMVWQDLWITGDCNGRWPDPKKSDNQEVRRKYPDDHELFIKSAADQVKMLRNHPSLVIWCGGNEFPPPDNIDAFLKDSLFPSLDPSRFYLSESTGQELARNTTGGTGNGPYHLMEPSWFFTHRSLAFNTEIGSVGLPEEESLRKILSPQALVIPDPDNTDPEWQYHKYLSYGGFPARYGAVKDFSDFVKKAQLVNYDQYRALQEGHNARAWEWYTGMLVWKVQNPWTALKGQFYDQWLEPNAGYYGYMHAARPFHVQINLDDMRVCVINSTPRERHDSYINLSIYDLAGKLLSTYDTLITAAPNSVTRLNRVEIPAGATGVVFARLSIRNKVSGVLSDENLYWLPVKDSDYSALEKIRETDLSAEVFRVSGSKIDISITNTGIVPAFFVRLRIVSGVNGEVVAPAGFEDNYITLMPGEKKFIKADLSVLGREARDEPLILQLSGFNVADKKVVF